MKRTKKAITAVAKPKPFAEMTNSEQRVAVARDVIMQLDAKKFVPKMGVYFTISDFAAANKPPEDGAMPACTVCAIGAVFASGCFAKTGMLPLYWVRPDATSELEIFDYDTLSRMESAFEIWGGRYRAATDFGMAVAPGHSREDADKRMRAIMQNVIDNDGEFVP